eukprot:5064556-Prymnesium_polylepis.1
MAAAHDGRGGWVGATVFAHCHVTVKAFAAVELGAARPSAAARTTRVWAGTLAVARLVVAVPSARRTPGATCGRERRAARHAARGVRYCRHCRRHRHRHHHHSRRLRRLQCHSRCHLRSARLAGATV